MQDPTTLASRPVELDDGQVRLSLPEIESLTARAARGAGLGWGLADEAGRASVWLARSGLDWATPLLTRLEGVPGADFRPTPGTWTSDGPTCGLKIGVALSDFATLPEGPATELALGPVMDALLVLPFAARASAAIGAPLRLDIYGAPAAWVSGGTLVAIDGGVPALPICNLRIVRVTDQSLPAGQNRQDDKGFPISAALWNRLDRHALGMTVPATEQSLAGAGAGTRDND